MLTYQQIQTKLISIAANAAATQEEAIKLMKELEQFSAPDPSKGKHKAGPLSREEVSKILGNRLRKIGQQKQ
jgi:hypothetical protein